jgi:hypothetical protein
MATISENYPDRQSDQEIRQTIKGFSDEMFKAKFSINSVMQYSPLIQLGHDELQNRQSKRYMKGSFAMAGFSLLISIIAVCIAISSSRVSSRWEDKQLPLLQQLINETKTQTEQQISIAETHLATIKEMKQTASKKNQQLNISIESIKQNVEIIKKNSEKPEEPVEDVSTESDDSLQTSEPRLLVTPDM